MAFELVDPRLLFAVQAVVQRLVIQIGELAQPPQVVLGRGFQIDPHIHVLMSPQFRHFVQRLQWPAFVFRQQCKANCHRDDYRRPRQSLIARNRGLGMKTNFRTEQARQLLLA